MICELCGFDCSIPEETWMNKPRYHYVSLCVGLHTYKRIHSRWREPGPRRTQTFQAHGFSKSAAVPLVSKKLPPKKVSCVSEGKVRFNFRPPGGASVSSERTPSGCILHWRHNTEELRKEEYELRNLFHSIRFGVEMYPFYRLVSFTHLLDARPQRRTLFNEVTMPVYSLKARQPRASGRQLTTVSFLCFLSILAQQPPPHSPWAVWHGHSLF